MSRRKNVEIAAVVTKANQYLRESPQNEVTGRKMLRTFVESILHDTDAYNGFRYLGANEVKPGDLCGILFDDSEARKHVYPDETRVAYNVR